MPIEFSVHSKGALLSK